jgi:hypothetical protein
MSLMLARLRSVETADELEETTVALKMDTAIFDYVAIILACFHPDAAWDQAKRGGATLDLPEATCSRSSVPG